MNGIYYNEINFSMGLLLGAIGFSAAVIGGLGNIYGAILGGFIFAFLQTIGAVAPAVFKRFTKMSLPSASLLCLWPGSPRAFLPKNPAKGSSHVILTQYACRAPYLRAHRSGHNGFSCPVFAG